MNKNIICKNCNKPFHTLKQCKYPITSYGIILFRIFNKELQYLMIRRKNSFGYIDFIKGQYSENNLEYLQKLFDEMSVEEKELIQLNEDFDILWRRMWEDNIKSGIFNHSKQKFIHLKTTGIIQNLIDSSSTKWIETEWEFPKGRRNYKESDLNTAIREFEEETNINRKYFEIKEHKKIYKENYIGDNLVKYEHRYYLAELYNKFPLELDPNNIHQKIEVGKLEWINIKCAKNLIDNFYTNRLEIIDELIKELY